MKRKRLISIIGLILCAVSSLCLFSACNDDTHTHNYTTEVIAPTCAEQGYTIYTCDCGNSYNADYTSALGHNFINYISNNDATFESDGTKTAVCERDGCNVTDTKIDVGSILTHSHNYTTEVIAPTCTEQGYTIYTCDCGNSYNADYVDALGHSFVNYISNNDATYEADGTKTATCEREECVETNTITDIGSILTHTHNYDTEVILPTCTKQGYTVYACDCGNSYNADYTSALGHSFVNYISNNDATYDADGTKTATCERTGCNQTNTITDIGSMLVHNHDYDTEVISPTCTEQGYTVYTCDCGNSYNADYTSALGHSFVNYVSNNDATYDTDGTKTAICERTGCNQTNTITDIGSMLVKNGIVFKTLTLNVADNTVYGKVANGTQVFSFLNEIQVLGNSSYTVSTDITGINIIPTKTVPLIVGDNVFYVLADNQNNDLVLYTVTIRVRPLYSVTFNTQSENNIESQSIEEDSFATMPSDSIEKMGYTFIGWDFEFATPITENITVTANWKANEYTVSFDGNGVKNPESIVVTYNNTYKDLPTPERDGYTFNGWFTQKDGGTQIASTDMVQITADQTLYAYWIINTYSLSITKNINDAGTIKTNIANGTYEYLTEVTYEILTTNLGYDYLGLYDGETLITTDVSYTFALPANNVNYTAKWQVKEEMSSFNFTSTTTGCVINGLKDTNVTKIVIPDYVHYVKRCYGDNIISITIGKGVKHIDDGAFKNCYYLDEINFNATKMEDDLTRYDVVFSYAGIRGEGITLNIGADVTSIPSYLFYASTDESPKITNIVFAKDSTCQLIGAWAFRNCNSLANVVIPKSVVCISDYAFANCSGLTDIVIPNSVTKILTGAFLKCTSLTEIAIPDSVITMGYHAIGDCTNLSVCCEASTKPSNWNSNWNDGTCAVLWNCKSTTTKAGVKYALTNDDVMIVYGCDDTVTEIEIENSIQGYSVTAINEKAFYENKNLASLIIGDNVTSIAYKAFYNCTALTNITIGDSVTNIGDFAFYNCSGLTVIEVITGNNSYHSDGNCLIETATNTLILGCMNSIIPTDGSVTNIGSYSFYGCSQLTTITIPNSVTNIADYVFYNCSNLSNVTMGTGVTSIGRYSFYNCDLLKNITIPRNIKKISEYAFAESGIVSVTFEYTLGWLVDFSNGSKSIDVTNPTANAGNLRSSYCSYSWSNDLVGKATITLESLSIYEGGLVGAGTFITDSQITISALAPYLGYNWLGWYCEEQFVSSDMSYTFNVPATNTTYTAKYEVKTEMLNFVFNSNETYCSISGIIDDTVNEIIIPDYVTNINYGALSNCNVLEELTIPFIGGSMKTSLDTDQYPLGYIFGNENNSYTTATKQVYFAENLMATVTTTYYLPISLHTVTVTGGNILWGAFSGCANITTINIPQNITEIGGYAFYNCTALTEITIPKNVVSIGNQAFYSCSSLLTINFNASDMNNLLESSKVFDGTGNTEIGMTVKIGANVKKIPNYLFYAFNGGISGLTNIQFEQNSQCENIGAFAFTYCPLEQVVLPDSILSIGEGAFKWCQQLNSITIGKNVVDIGAKAFWNCNRLTEINYNAASMSDLSFDSNVFSININYGDTTKVIIGVDVLKIPKYLFYTDTTDGVSYPPKITELVFASETNAQLIIGAYAFNTLSLEKIYYKGSSTQWNNIVIEENNTAIDISKVYFYSENAPVLNSEGTAYNGNYWHYVGGKETIWVL